MIESIHKILLWIHIPFGTLSLILFWIPIGVKKGSPTHRKVGLQYYRTMWVVVITAVLMSVCNLIMGQYILAAFLGYLAIVTAYPLWYSYEILRQDKEWSTQYFTLRKIFVLVMFFAGIGMFLLGAVKFRFEGMGIAIAFFGLLAIPAARDIRMSKTQAMDKESKLKMHIKGTIISGIAAYTAFFAFGGSKFIMEVLQIGTQWMVVPWVAPTLLGLIYSKYMRKKYGAV